MSSGARRRSTRTLESKGSHRRFSFLTSPSCSPNPCGPRKISVVAEPASVSPLSPDGVKAPALFDPFDEDEGLHRPLLVGSPTLKSAHDCGSTHNTPTGVPQSPSSPTRHRQQQRHTHEHRAHHQTVHHQQQQQQQQQQHMCAPQKPLSWFQQLRLKVYKTVFFRALPTWCSKTLAEFSALLIGAHASDVSEPASQCESAVHHHRVSSCTKETSPTADGMPILEGFFVAAVQLGLCDAKVCSLALGGSGLAEAFHRCCEELHALLWSFLRAAASESPAGAVMRTDPTAFAATAKNLQHVLSNAIQGSTSLSTETRAGLVESLHYAFTHLTDAQCVRCWLGHAANESHLRALHASLTHYLQSC